MSFLLFFQNRGGLPPDPDPQPPMGIGLGSKLVPSGTLTFNEEILFLDIAVEHGAEALVEFFPNTIDLLVKSTPHVRMFFLKENDLQIFSKSTSLINIEFCKQDAFDVVINQPQSVFISFAKDGVLRFFDIDAHSFPVTSVSFASSGGNIVEPDLQDDYVLKYIEFIV